MEERVMKNDELSDLDFGLDFVDYLYVDFLIA